MRAPRGKNWKLLGRVGVDSGQLMICDPCYIESEWKPGTESAGHDTIVLTDKGKRKFPGSKNWSWQYNGYGTTYESPQEALGGLSVNDAIDQKLVKALPQETTNEFSYRGCCETAKKGSVALKFKAGHMGAGVCFSSGYGDGCYEVWGKVNSDGRFVEVRVIMG